MTDNKIRFDDKGLLGKDLLKMLEQGSLNDVKIKLSDGEIVANKDILMARSEYFGTMFSKNKFIEGETNSVDMGHCSKTVMEKIIKYFFSGSVTFDGLSLAQLLELSHISEMMLLSKFKAKVDDYLRLYIRGCGNGVKFLPEIILGAKIADNYNLSSIGLDIMLEVFLNLKDIPNNVASSDAFKSLPFKVIREIIQYNLMLSSGRTPTTKQKFEAFMVWLSENDNEVTIEDKMEFANRFSFNFDDFTVEELMTSVRDSGLYSSTKIDEEILEKFKKQEELLKETNDDLKYRKRQIKLARKVMPPQYKYLLCSDDDSD